MKSRLLRLADWLSQSYWFLPAVLALLAMILAGGMIWLDSSYGSEWMDRFAWLYASRPDGARQVLSAIGGSMITVAGTVFSVTVAAVVFASGQYAPRLLSNFMRDRGNQMTLGTFIATFLYCLVVLRTVRSPEETGGVGFVPNMALLVAVVLAICSIAVLIFFIHHVPSKIHINNVIEEIGNQLLREVDRRFPRFIGQPHEETPDPDDPAMPAAFRKHASEAEADDRGRISARKTGYIQLVDEGELMQTACDKDLVCRMHHRPGDFIHAGRALVEVWPAERCDDAVERRLRDAFSIGSQRSARQDIRFLIDELVEIAARALSPGVNDPFTAITCLDWLSAALSDLSERELPSHLRADDSGNLRVIAHPLTFEFFLDRSFGALAQYCASDMVAAVRFLEALGEIAVGCDQPGRIAALGRYGDRLVMLAGRDLGGFNYQRVAGRGAELREALQADDYQRRLRDIAWLGGNA